MIDENIEKFLNLNKDPEIFSPIKIDNIDFSRFGKVKNIDPNVCDSSFIISYQDMSTQRSSNMTIEHATFDICYEESGQQTEEDMTNQCQNSLSSPIQHCTERNIGHTAISGALNFVTNSQVIADQEESKDDEETNYSAIPPFNRDDDYVCPLEGSMEGYTNEIRVSNSQEISSPINMRSRIRPAIKALRDKYGGEEYLETESENKLGSNDIKCIMTAVKNEIQEESSPIYKETESYLLNKYSDITMKDLESFAKLLTSKANNSFVKSVSDINRVFYESKDVKQDKLIKKEVILYSILCFLYDSEKFEEWARTQYRCQKECQRSSIINNRILIRDCFENPERHCAGRPKNREA